MSPSRAQPPERDDPVAEIEAMITRLSALRDQERDPSIATAYRAALERLHGLAYRLQTRPETPRVIGLRGKAAEPDEAPDQEAPEAPAHERPPEAPQRTLPLGPVPVIVKARKPRRH